MLNLGGEVEVSSDEEELGFPRKISTLALENVPFQETTVPVPASEAEVGEVVLKAEISVAVVSGAGHQPIQITSQWPVQSLAITVEKMVILHEIVKWGQVVDSHKVAETEAEADFGEIVEQMVVVTEEVEERLRGPRLLEEGAVQELRH